MKTKETDWNDLLHHEPHEVRFEDSVIHVEDNVFTPDPERTNSTSIIIDHLPSVSGLRVADVGTGTGAIAIVVAHRGAREVVATDVSEAAIRNARTNVATNNVGTKVHVIITNLLNEITGKFDIICANLPI